MRIGVWGSVMVALLVLTPQPTFADGEDLVIARKGDLPILLTAPHGGTLGVLGVTKRSSGKVTRDAGTLEVALGLVDRITKELGAAPYLVAARFKREHIDANRSEAEALEDPAARPAYREYHRRVREFVDEIRTRFPNRGLLIDLHGQGSDENAIFRGTQNGKTLFRLLQAQGQDAVTGPDSVLGYLEDKGYRIIPPRSAGFSQREAKEYNGGYTVMMYGSNQVNGIDALQVEMGLSLRQNRAFTDDLAQAISRFSRRYELAGQPPR